MDVSCRKSCNWFEVVTVSGTPGNREAVRKHGPASLGIVERNSNDAAYGLRGLLENLTLYALIPFHSNRRNLEKHKKM